jgi:serine/threonine protein kinase
LFTVQDRNITLDLSVVLKDVACAIQHCHEQGVMHRDIKPENIIVTASSVAVLIDFGLATTEKHDSDICGTYVHMAPEVHFGMTYSNKVDVWSFGVLAYELACGHPPWDFSDDIERAVMRNIVCGGNIACPDDMPDDLQRFCKAILIRDPRSRPDISVIVKALQVCSRR